MAENPDLKQQHETEASQQTAKAENATAEARSATDNIKAAINELMAEGKEPQVQDNNQNPAEGAAPEQDEIAALMAERDELRDKYMRALAEAENIRKRAERDRREAERYGATRLARDLLPVFDNLQRALDAAGDAERKAAPALIEGIELTLRELLSVFEKHGITPVAPEVGDRFDPEVHEAMFEAPLPGTKAGDIIQVDSYGFKLHDRLLRPAKVGVSSHKE